MGLEVVLDYGLIGGRLLRKFLFPPFKSLFSLKNFFFPKFVLRQKKVSHPPKIKGKFGGGREKTSENISKKISALKEKFERWKEKP
ncbi:hypothetical protein QL285_012226 [Trifolium repens]|nr:hypothetical protein QL285_012226 [Trifolium repens]